MNSGRPLPDGYRRRRRKPCAVDAIVDICNHGVVEMRTLARLCLEQTIDASGLAKDGGGIDNGRLEQLLSIANTCDGLLGALVGKFRREKAAWNALAWRWGASSDHSRQWMVNTLLVADPRYKGLIASLDKARERMLSKQPAPWVQELGINESDSRDWRRAIFGEDETTT